MLYLEDFKWNKYDPLSLHLTGGHFEKVFMSESSWLGSNLWEVA